GNKMTETVLHVGGLHWATSEPIIESTLLDRPGVTAVVASAVSQTATVTYDPDRTSVEQLTAWVRECGYHCAGPSVPTHVCIPTAEAGADAGRVMHEHDHHDRHHAHVSHDHAAHGGRADPASHDGHESADSELRSPHDMMGHGGHAGMSMDAMVRDMRNRF